MPRRKSHQPRTRVIEPVVDFVETSGDINQGTPTTNNMTSLSGGTPNFATTRPRRDREDAPPTEGNNSTFRRASAQAHGANSNYQPHHLEARGPLNDEQYLSPGHRRLQEYLIHQQLLAGIPRENVVLMPHNRTVNPAHHAPTLIQITDEGLSVPNIPPASFNGTIQTAPPARTAFAPAVPIVPRVPTGPAMPTMTVTPAVPNIPHVPQPMWGMFNGSLNTPPAGTAYGHTSHLPPHYGEVPFTVNDDRVPVTYRSPPHHRRVPPHQAVNGYGGNAADYLDRSARPMRENFSNRLPSVNFVQTAAPPPPHPVRREIQPKLEPQPEPRLESKPKSQLGSRLGSRLQREPQPAQLADPPYAGRVFTHGIEMSGSAPVAFPFDRLSRQRSSVPTPQHNGFDLLQAFSQHTEIAIVLTEFLNVDDIIKIYAISKPFHEVVDANLMQFIGGQTMHKYYDAERIYPYLCYPALCKNYGDPIHENPAADPMEINPIPTLRYLGMVAYREDTLNKITRTMLDAGHGVPRLCESAIRKIWFLMDIPDTGRRLWTIQNRKIWSDMELFFAHLFIVRIDILIKRLKNIQNTELRKLAMAQPSLTFLSDLLQNKILTTDHDTMHAIVRWKYIPTPEEQGVPIFGVPPDEIGMLQFEYYGQLRNDDSIGGGRAGGRRLTTKLTAPDEMILKEGVRRGIDFQQMYRDVFLQWNFTRYERHTRGETAWDEEVEAAVGNSNVQDLFNAFRLD